MVPTRFSPVDFQPFVSFDAWTYKYGRLSYTVPAGWTNGQEDRSLYVISQQVDGPTGEDHSIWLLSDEAAHKQAADCAEGQVDASVARTPTALAAWLATVPGLTTTKPQDVTLGGGKLLTIGEAQIPVGDASLTPCDPIGQSAQSDTESHCRRAGESPHRCPHADKRAQYDTLPEQGGGFFLTGRSSPGRLGLRRDGGIGRGHERSFLSRHIP